jgi:hypothetical protein
MALKKIVMTVAVLAGAQAFAHSRVQDALTLNETQPAATKKVEKSSKATKKIIESLNSSEQNKTELPKNARHDATGGVFI